MSEMVELSYVSRLNIFYGKGCGKGVASWKLNHHLQGRGDDSGLYQDWVGPAQIWHQCFILDLIWFKLEKSNVQRKIRNHIPLIQPTLIRRFPKVNNEDYFV